MAKKKPKSKQIAIKSDPQDLSAAIIRSYRKDLMTVLKKSKSDAALIESLNRYIEALEGKAKMLEEKNKELSSRLEVLNVYFSRSCDQNKQ